MPEQMGQVDSAPQMSLPAPLDGSVFLNVAGGVLARALRTAVESVALLVAAGPSASVILVSDDLVRDENLLRARAIEVVAPRARWAKRAIDNVKARASVGVVLTDEAEMLSAALFACMNEGAFIPTRAFDLAEQLPLLSERQDEVLTRLALGDSNREIVDSLHVSRALVNREIQAIEQLLGVSGRAALMGAAFELGFV